MGMPIIGPQASERRGIITQLKQREASCLAFWSENKQRREAFEAISKIIQRDFGYPNNYFIPEDPFEILFWFWDDFDGMAAVEASMNLEDKFGISLSEQDFVKMLNMTLGEVVDFIVSKSCIHPPS
jgi:acyl carrier protein